MNVILNLSIVHSVLTEWIKRSAWNEPLNVIFNATFISNYVNNCAHCEPPSTIYNPLIIIEIDVVNDLISFYFSVIRDS